MATFGQIQADIATKLVRTDLTDQIKAGINEAIGYYKESHLWFNEATTTITLNVGDPLVPNIPDDFLYEIMPDGLVINYSNVNYPLTKKTPLEYDLMNLQGIGLPAYYTNKVDNLYVYFYPDQAYDLTLYYVKNYDDLVNSGDSNDWTTYAQRLITAKTMADLYRYNLKELERSNDLLAEASRNLDQIQSRSRRRTITGNLITENLVDQVGGDYGFYSGRYW
jgi:hypothetical protein